nr:coiled-coil domain-containing protein 22 homolog isoform X1 [Ipomoea batatas]
MESIVDSVDIPISGAEGSEAGILQNVQDSVVEVQVDNLGNDSLKHQGNVTQGNDEHNLDHEQHKDLQFESKTKYLQNQDKILQEDLASRSSELRHLQEKQDLLKAAIKMSSCDQHPIDFYVKQLSDQVEARRQDLAKMEAQWDAQRIVLEEEKMRLEEALRATHPEVYVKFKKLEEIDKETECIIAEIKRREEEVWELSAELGKQPNLEPRKTYIQRIIEITKNSRKQDVDVDKILKDTRELQLESNSIQERLHRTYAVVDETIFREAKKDPAGKQAYRILTSIHDSFEQIAERLHDTDRARRERADIEAKLANMTSRSLDIEKLRADLDAVKNENDLLERKILTNNSSKNFP